MLRPSAPAAGGLRRGRSCRLAFLLPYTQGRRTPGAADCVPGGACAFLPLRAFCFAYLLRLSLWLQPLAVLGRRKSQAWGGRKEASQKPRPPLRADPARILHASFLFSSFFVSPPLLFFPLFPPFLPSLPSVVGSVFWYFLPPPPQAAVRPRPVAPCGSAGPTRALGRSPRFAVRWRCGRRGGAWRAEGGAARGPARPGQVRRSGSRISGP